MHKLTQQRLLTNAFTRGLSEVSLMPYSSNAHGLFQGMLTKLCQAAAGTEQSGWVGFLTLCFLTTMYKLILSQPCQWCYPSNTSHVLKERASTRILTHVGFLV